MGFDIIEFLQYFFIAILEMLFVLVITRGLLQHSLGSSKSVLYKTILFASISALIAYNGTNNLLFRILPLIAHLIFILILTQKSIIQSAYIGIISYSCILVIQLGIIVIYNFTALNQNSFFVQIFANILTLIISSLIVHFVPIYHIYDFMLRKDIALRFLFGNTFAIVFLASYLVVAHLPHFIYYFAIIIIAVALLCFVNIVLLRSRIMVDKQKAIIDNYNTYLPIIDELIEQVRGRQHGYDNNLQALSALSVTCEDYETLRTELLKNIDAMSHSDLPMFILKLNLKLLSGMLVQKYSLANKKNINMDFSINNYNIQSTVPEYIIIEAVGILIDNAIEASNENDTIYISIDCVNNKFVFEIKNIGPILTSEFYNNIFKRGYSTKPNIDKKHGIGLNTLLELIHKNKGQLSVSNEVHLDNNLITFKIEL